MKKPSTLDIIVYVLCFILFVIISSKIYSRLSKPNLVDSKTLIVTKINKICMDLPSGITECVEGNSSQVYKVLLIPDPNNQEISTIYLKVK